MFISQLELPSLIFVTLTTVALGGIVFYRKRKAASGILFVLMSFSFASWAIVNYFSLHAPFGSSLIWIRLVMFFAAPQAVLFALLMHTLPGDNIRLPRGSLVAWVGVLILQMIFAISPYVFLRTSGAGGHVVPHPGWGMLIYAPILVFSFVVGIYWLIKRFIQMKHGKERISAMIIMVGFGSMIASVLGFLFFAVVVFGNTTFIPISPLFILPLVFSIGYTLTRQSFLNIRLIATEFSVSILTIVLLTDAFLSNLWFTILWKTAFAFFVGWLGYKMIDSVHREIEQRQQLSRLSANLKRANNKLKELDELKTEFMSIATHQLRTPLSIIKGYCSLLCEGAYGGVNKKEKEVLNNIDVSNERLIKLVDEFLNVSRIEQGRTQYSFDSMDFVAMTKGIVAELGEKATPKNIKLNSKIGKGVRMVVADEERLRHCLYNFVDNAIKYSPEEATITVFVEKSKGGLEARVVDEGVGLDKKDLENLFQKFYRSPHVVRDFQGTGLGLFVVKKFIEAHGGNVFVESRGLGKGSEFGFWIPTKAKRKQANKTGKK